MTTSNPFASIARAVLPSLGVLAPTQELAAPPQTPYPVVPSAAAGQGGAASGIAIPTQGVPATLYNVFTSAGFTPTAIYGILGNAQQESGFNPHAFNAKEGAGGIFQHRLDRLTNGQNWVNAQGLDWNDPTGRAQALWAVQEIERDPALKAALNAAQTPEEAATIFDRRFEKSAGLHTTNRQQYARQWAGGTPSPYTIPQEMARSPSSLLPQGFDQATMDAINARVAHIQGQTPPQGQQPTTTRTRTTAPALQEPDQTMDTMANTPPPTDTYDPNPGAEQLARAKERAVKRRTAARSLPRVQIPGRG